MLTRTKFFLFLFVLQCPPSLLIPLAQQDVASTSNTNNLVVLGTNNIEQITPSNSIDTELLQQIDVKDDENHVISNINHVVVSDENIQKDNNIHGLQNNLANETKTNALNTTSKANINNTSIKAVRTVQNGSISNVNVSSTPTTNLASRRTTISTSTENVSTLNNNFSSGMENEETGVPTLATIDGENILHESFIDGDAKIAWRSNIPVKKNKARAKLNSQNAILLANNINDSVNNNNSDLLNSENGDEKSIFVILNSGNIDGISVNSPVKSGNFQPNLENKTIENLNSSYSKLLNNLINSTINDVFSKILKQNISNSNYNHIFVLLNSGSISNVQVSSPVLENIVKNANLKDRSRRHLNDSNTNNTDVESLALKPSTDKSNPINDIKFRPGEHQGTQNNVNKNNLAATLDNNQNNSTLITDAPDNGSLAYSNATVVDIPIEDISSAEAPAFRSLIPDKIRKLQQVSNVVVNNELNETQDHNFVLKLSPEPLPISIDLNQTPINNLLGGALSFVKRLKRNTHDKSENAWKLNCKSKQIDEHHIVKICKKSQSFNNDLIIKTTPTKKSIDDNISNELNQYDSVELVCPLSAVVKLYTHQVLDNIAKNDSNSVLNKIISSFVKGNEDSINLASKELSNLPIPVMLRFELVHGKTKEFMEQLSDIVDATLCSLS